jgi:hypothetical protein
MSGGVWQEPGGPSSPYDFYSGEVGVFQQYAGCGGNDYYNMTAADDANYDTSQVYAMGSTPYYMLAGPGINGNYGSSSAAYNWGYNQAEWLLNNQIPAIGLPNNNKIIWLDIEGYENSGSYSNGWNSEGNSCGARTGGSSISGSIDRVTFNGFYDAMSNAGYRVGAYSSAQFWDFTFGGYGNIPNTLEWTYESQAQVNPAPPLGSWCTQGVCAQFFGGQIDGGSNALVWQWSNSSTNGSGDYDVSAW